MEVLICPARLGVEVDEAEAQPMSYLDYDEMTQALQSSGTKILMRLSTRLITNILLLVAVLLLLVQTLRPRAGRYEWKRDSSSVFGVFDTATGKLYLTDPQRGTFVVDLAHERRAASQPVSPPPRSRTPAPDDNGKPYHE